MALFQAIVLRDGIAVSVDPDVIWRPTLAVDVVVDTDSELIWL